MISLQILIGLTVEKVEEVHDYIQVVFSDGTALSIFNNHDYDGGSVLSIVGKAVITVTEFDSSIFIYFEGGQSLSIGFKDDDYNGPEAMVLLREGKSPIVWG